MRAGGIPNGYASVLHLVDTRPWPGGGRGGSLQHGEIQPIPMFYTLVGCIYDGIWHCPLAYKVT